MILIKFKLLKAYHDDGSLESKLENGSEVPANTDPEASNRVQPNQNMGAFYTPQKKL